MFERITLVGLCLVCGCVGSGWAETPKRLLLLCQGPDGHPAATHEYAAGVKVIEKCLKGTPGLEVSVVRADGAWKEGPDWLGRADGVVLFLSEGAQWIDLHPHLKEAFARLAARKGGLVALHWATGTRDARPIDPYLQLLGGCHGGPDRRYKVLETDVQVARDHPIASGIAPFRVRDEFYYQLKFVKPADRPRPVLKVVIDGQVETVAWAWERSGGGRSFGFTGLHFHDNWRLPEYRRLVAQGVLWTLNLPIPKDGLRVDLTDEDLKLKP